MIIASRVTFTLDPDKVEFTVQNIESLIAHNKRNRSK